jgi:hypothetical protein
MDTYKASWFPKHSLPQLAEQSTSTGHAGEGSPFILESRMGRDVMVGLFKVDLGRLQDALRTELRRSDRSPRRCCADVPA